MPAVAISGVSEPVGQVLRKRLARDAAVERVVGLEGRERALGVSVDGTRRLLALAHEARVEAMVCVSSAMVYGAWPNNPVPLTEDAPLRPNPGVSHATEKAEVERLVGEWAADHPDVAVAVLRPATVVGPRSPDWEAKVFYAGRQSWSQPAQFLHHEDLTAAVQLALEARLDGAFNVAPDGSIPIDELRALTSGRIRVRGAAEIARQPGLAPYFQHPWVVANDRLRAAGWQPRYDNEEAFVAADDPSLWQAMSARRRRTVMLGGAGLGLAGVAAGVGALVWRLRRR